LARAAVLPFAGLILLFFIFSPAPLRQKQTSSFIYSNPLISKAFLGSISPLAADFAWLESTKIGEAGRGDTLKVDKNEIKTAFITIASLDPYFYHAINYGVTFLSTIPKDKEASFEVLDRALLQNPNDFRLLYLKLITELTSSRPDKILLKNLAEKVFINPDFKGVFGVIKVDDFLLEILAFAGDEAAKKKQLQDELKWLKKNTKDKNKKALIDAKLKELD
jgi:hypothetical protein